MYTYQDFMADCASDSVGAVKKAIQRWSGCEDVRIAREADAYDCQQNITINNFVRLLYENGNVPSTGQSNKLSSNFFNRLNTQRMTYSLGNGVTFETDVKDRLGKDFDTQLRTAGYFALIHKMSFMFLNVDHVHVFKITEFCPLWDEETGALMAGIRYWRIDANKPLVAVLYELDGFTKFKEIDGKMAISEPKRAYRRTLAKAPADAEPEVIAEENYNGLPIVPVYGSRLHQSTLVGMRGGIDAYDLLRSGFANTLQDCSEIYWLVTNAGGMDNDMLKEFRDRLNQTHIANVMDADDVSVNPYTPTISYDARQKFLADVRSSIYEDFGGLDVHTVAAGATNDHIDAAYQPLDENADDYEYQIIEAVQKLLALIGVEDTPIFHRNRISNMKEQVDMIMECANVLDDETILKKLPFVTVDEVDQILQKKDVEEMNAFGGVEDGAQTAE